MMALFVCLLYSFRERSVCAFVCHGVCVDIRVQLAGVDFPLPQDSSRQILAIRLMWGALFPSGTTMERWCAPSCADSHSFCELLWSGWPCQVQCFIVTLPILSFWLVCVCFPSFKILFTFYIPIPGPPLSSPALPTPIRSSEKGQASPGKSTKSVPSPHWGSTKPLPLPQAEQKTSVSSYNSSQCLKSECYSVPPLPQPCILSLARQMAYTTYTEVSSKI